MSTLLSRKPEGFCSSCKRVTVYDCLKCKIKICNECSTFEENENVEGWRMGKAVGYCEGCFLAKSDSEDESSDHETSNESMGQSLSEHEGSTATG